jgi:hypothetical protein
MLGRSSHESAFFTGAEGRFRPGCALRHRHGASDRGRSLDARRQHLRIITMFLLIVVVIIVGGALLAYGARVSARADQDSLGRMSVEWLAEHGASTRYWT